MLVWVLRSVGRDVEHGHGEVGVAQEGGVGFVEAGCSQRGIEGAA